MITQRKGQKIYPNFAISDYSGYEGEKQAHKLNLVFSW